MTLPSRRLVAAGLLALLAAAGCSRKPKGSPTPSTSAQLVAPSSTPAASATESKSAGPKVLATLPFSAYHARVVLDDEAVYVLTEKMVYRYAAGEKPRQVEKALLPWGASEKEVHQKL